MPKVRPSGGNKLGTTESRGTPKKGPPVWFVAQKQQPKPDPGKTWSGGGGGRKTSKKEKEKRKKPTFPNPRNATQIEARRDERPETKGKTQDETPVTTVPKKAEPRLEGKKIETGKAPRNRPRTESHGSPKRWAME